MAVAFYRTWDIGSQRVHHWLPSGKWAIGNGPIRYVTEGEAQALLATKDTNHPATRADTQGGESDG